MTRYLVPAYAGAEGIEDFAVEDDQSRRLGRVAAVNRTPNGLMVVVAEGDGFGVLPAATLTSLDARRRIARVERGTATQPADVSHVHSDDPQLVRYLPRDLERLLVAGDEVEATSWWTPLAIALLAFAGLALLPVHLIVEREGPVGLVAIVLPLGFLAGALWALARAAASESGEPMTLREALATVPAFLLGTSPLSSRRRRG